ncbi:RIP metalloprotease RseP [Rickettsiales endosymbiont of Peranema trichophorum]|uniref:RIP metalloprotease RseP n=1 Tax=Rickettsiales endosymbiont of Peranema trichophorum TaxID=2486577 RepID=UPI001023C1E5|nr:RIP metalloprotease RseP [Rickettsiales endosymbiont of Peranema trichophorum]RZI45638.1 RIP metalloprotease RseP [Rickettsiales endosymbiont of Peranema trichophorum]
MPSFLETIEAIYWFAIVVSIIVFIHEFGHYFIARCCGVKVETFSIGFGKELFGFTDSRGTRWKLSLIPLGGYIKMLGDDISGPGELESMGNIPEFDIARSFYHKPLWQRASIVAAGPLANYVSAILILAILVFANGKVLILPEIGGVAQNSPAELAGIRPGDIVSSVNGTEIKSFTEIQEHLLLNIGEPVKLEIIRNSLPIEVAITPQIPKAKEGEDTVKTTPILGVTATGKFEKIQYNIFESFVDGTRVAMNVSRMMLKGLYQMLSGNRAINEIGGPIKIAQYSRKSAEGGIAGVLSLIVILSINLGLLNLFPIPVLDGGHLAYYMIELVIGKSWSQKIQPYWASFGLLILIALTCFAFVNDIRSLFTS